MFLSLHRLLVYLDARKQAVKLHIYRQLTVVLTASLILGVMYAAYQIHFTINQQQMVKWASLWLLDQGIPFMIYTLILLSIAALWRPSAEGKQYQYSQLQVGDGEVDDDELNMEKNERGEAGDSEDDEDDAGLDVEEEEVEAPPEEEETKPPQKMRAQFSIGEEGEEQPKKAMPAPPLLSSPQEPVNTVAPGTGEVKVVVNDPTPVGANAVGAAGTTEAAGAAGTTGAAGAAGAAAPVKKAAVKAKKVKPVKQ